MKLSALLICAALMLEDLLALKERYIGVSKVKEHWASG